MKLDFGHQDVGGVLVSAAASFDWPASGFTHMSPGDVARIDTLDGWTVHMPGHPDEAEILLRHAVGAGAGKDDKVYVRLSPQSNTPALAVDGSGSERCARGAGVSWSRSGRCSTPCSPPRRGST